MSTYLLAYIVSEFKNISSVSPSNVQVCNWDYMS